MRRILTAVAAALLFAGTALSHEFKIGDLEIDHPASKATLPGQPVGGGFLTIVNHGDAADRLVSVTAPAVSDDVQLHEMTIENDVMTMRRLAGGVEIPAGGTVDLKPGGLHIMFMGLKQPLKEGEKIAATLTFEKAGTVDVEFNIESGKPSARHDDAKAGEGAHEDH
ncbi:copper chaperone PCu(A)C [Rhizobium sp. TRM95111]|uniref:copper chaperone PCu(A)C n=1 Tax=Rhizobium alarense TaxID=2846851 RepID=UPI001F2580A8|nr:copper chaperone PCu(A)C [Rhizobium alarense]MCF3638532.1 copper chaperone PCu(A)C [Rhizobium alarense]